MKIPTKFVSSLKKKQRKKLAKLIKNDPSARVRMRAHAILLSAQGWSIDTIAEIYQVRRQTVSSWIDYWEQSGVNGLRDNPKSGSPPKLTTREKKIAEDLLIKSPQSPKTVLAKLMEKIGKQISRSTLKRIAKSCKRRWKRIKRALKAKRDKKKYRKAKRELKALERQHQNGEINLVYFDESGFSLHPVVPYAWQLEGENIEIFSPCKSKRLNVLGFFTKDNNLESFCFEGSVDARVVVACIDAFCKTINTRKVVVLDNASMHVSEEFEENIPKWERKGLFLKYLPAYSPELNWIEILWRFIKYQWLPFSAYLSFKHLVEAVEDILRNVGLEYEISFS